MSMADTQIRQASIIPLARPVGGSFIALARGMESPVEDGIKQRALL